MTAPRNRRRGGWPVLPTRTMDLLGIGKDGNLYLWHKAALAQPLDRFPMQGTYIINSHYVIERRGKAITAHISSTGQAGKVELQYMCGGLPTITVGRRGVEQSLLNRYMPDEKEAAEISKALRRLLDDETARQTAPHLRWGKA